MAMGRTRSEEKSQAGFEMSAGEMRQRLWRWRQSEPEASFDEIMARVHQERAAFMKPLLEELAAASGEVAMDVRCCECEGRMQNKGKKKRVVLHREGEVELKREYYYCPSCKRGFSPPGSEFGIEQAELESGAAGDGVASSG